MEVLRSNLERLKSTLVLMLNVLTYAKDLRAEYAGVFDRVIVCASLTCAGRTAAPRTMAAIRKC
jgi:hypothetical protein